MRNREHLFNLRPHDGVFAAFTLHYPEEIKAVQEIEEAGWAAKVQVDEGNLEMARAIVAHLSGDFAPEQYRDEYTHTLLDSHQGQGRRPRTQGGAAGGAAQGHQPDGGPEAAAWRRPPRAPAAGEKGDGPGRRAFPEGPEGSGR